ncbi:uncharacterized protein LOC122638631 [Telopea speciosissima]|uniref:uncharacterized protein LOC122638631 n=1 Tax=Telopea speciosissima TaxID=54955 RepID=UPI001CC5C826|nr:uncharacterized protein LOC122638631 [Telopea speciosissima]
MSSFKILLSICACISIFQVHARSFSPCFSSHPCCEELQLTVEQVIELPKEGPYSNGEARAGCRRVIRKLDPSDHLEGTSALDQAKDSRVATQATIRWRQMGNDEKMMVVQAEMKRVNQLPVSSSYATHRKRVLNKVLQLMSIQRSKTQEEELELLFAGLSL